MQFNTKSLSLPVTLGGGKRINMIVKPYEAAIDSDGYVRMFSMKFDNGTIGNFKLMPKSKAKSFILEMCADVLTPIGIRIVGEKFINTNNEIVTNIARYAFNHFATPPIQDLFRQYNIDDSAYYALDNGEMVISHPVKLW